jgi:hypothetical protein
MSSGLRIALAVGTLAASSSAYADGKQIDLGFSGGLNTPAGMGVEGVMRLDRIIAFGAAAGYGSWGPKLSVIGRVHLENSIAQGLFLEPSLSVNMGGTRFMDNATLPPVGNFTVAGGYRWSVLERAWVVLRLGQTFSFGAPSGTTANMPAATSTGDQFSRLLFRADAPPQGWVFGLATGASF